MGAFTGRYSCAYTQILFNSRLVQFGGDPDDPNGGSAGGMHLRVLTQFWLYFVLTVGLTVATIFAAALLERGFVRAAGP